MNTDYYHGKIIVGSSDGRDGIIIFETSASGGYIEDNCKGAEELVDKVRAILREKPKYELKDVQNGPTRQDGNHCGHYLDCFPALDERVFNYVMYRLEQQE